MTSTDMAQPGPVAPRVMAALSIGGLIPFVAAPLRLTDALGLGLDWASLQAVYAAAILAFLGGVRAALAAFAPRSDVRVLVVSMAPPLVGFGLAAAAVAGPLSASRTAGALLGLCLALAAQGAWDIGSKALPTWYRQLRLPVTIAACLALIAGALLAGSAA